jgi:hypothetical protein
MLDNEAAKEDIGRCRDTVALQILDLIEVRSSCTVSRLKNNNPPPKKKQAILPKLRSNPLRKRLLRVSSRLAEASQQMPNNSILQNIIWESHPRSVGGYGDVRRATYGNKTVAVKSFRIQLDQNSKWPALDGVSILLNLRNLVWD